MKTTIVSFIVLITLIGSSHAQNATFSVREEIVKPSMTPKFEAAMKKFKASCEEAKLAFSWNTIAFDDNTYLFISPLANTADLDKNPFAGLETKFGKEGAAKIWAEFDGCVESYSDYVITRMEALSYLTQTAGENSRDVTFWYVDPGKEGEAQAILAEWKKLYESKKIPKRVFCLSDQMGKRIRLRDCRLGKKPVRHCVERRKGPGTHGT